MASNITHIVLAKKALGTILNGKTIDFSKFYVGTLFPDIRKLGTISRETTHFKNPTKEKLLALTNSFDIGMYLHSLVDHDREQILEELGMYSVIEKTITNQTALKLLEDEVLYNEINNWEEIASYFSTIFREELALLPDKSELLFWHSLNKRYLLSETNPGKMAREMNINEKYINETHTVLDELRNNSKIIDLIHQMYDRIF